MSEQDKEKRAMELSTTADRAKKKKYRLPEVIMKIVITPPRVDAARPQHAPPGNSQRPSRSQRSPRPEKA
jgi:hypothetical protein